MLKLYNKAQCAFLEISLPAWPHQVLYMDTLYEEINEQCIFPRQLVATHQSNVGFRDQSLSANFFDKAEPEVDFDEDCLALVFDPEMMR